MNYVLGQTNGNVLNQLTIYRIEENTIQMCYVVMNEAQMIVAKKYGEQQHFPLTVLTNSFQFRFSHVCVSYWYPC